MKARTQFKGRIKSRHSNFLAQLSKESTNVQIEPLFCNNWPTQYQKSTLDVSNDVYRTTATVLSLACSTSNSDEGIEIR